MKNWIITGLSFLVVGFWWQMIALQAHFYNWSIINVFGDILPLGFNVGDCLLYIGYAISAVLLGRGIAWCVVRLIKYMSYKIQSHDNRGQRLPI